MSEKITHQSYFDGEVQSLSLNTEQGKATLGVMKKGSYTFSTSVPEKMLIISGVLQVTLANSESKAYQAQESFDVPANSSFEVSCAADVAYMCYYG